MHMRLRAPLLSAAASRVRIWIIALAPSARFGAFEDPHQGPALAPRQRTAGRDGDHVALAALVLLVVREQLRRTTDVLAVGRMLDQALDGHRDGLVHLVADHATGHRPLRFRGGGRGALGWFFGGHQTLPPARFWFSTVLTRAIDFLTRPNWFGLAGWPAAADMRRLNCSRRSFRSSSRSSAGDFALSSLTFIVRSAQRIVRLTKVVGSDSFEAARRNASRAVASVMPSISNSTLPGSTRATQYSTLPLPLPMRTSSGLAVTGTSGKTRIQICPPRLT